MKLVMKKIICPAILGVLLLFSFSSPVFGASPTPTPVPKAFSRAAFNPDNPDKNNFLTIWTDVRPYNTSSDGAYCYYTSGCPADNPKCCDNAIYGAFLDKNLSQTGSDFPIANVHYNEETYADVAYNHRDKEYMVVYMRCNDNCVGAVQADWNIYATRVKDDGSVLGPYEVNIEADRQYEPTVAYDEVNNRYLVAFMGLFAGSNGKDIKIQLLSAKGEKIGPSRYISIDEDGNNFPLFQERPNVVFIPEKRVYFLVWEDHHNGSVAGTILDADGNFLITPKNFFLGAGTGDKYYPQLEYNRYSQELWVTWQNSKSDRKTVEAQRVSSNGAPIGEIIMVDSNASPLDGNPRPGIGCDPYNGSCLITWMNLVDDTYGIKGQFFDQTGNPVGEWVTNLGGGYGGRATVIFNDILKYFLVLKTDQPDSPIKVDALPSEDCLKWRWGNLDCDTSGKINEADLTLLLGGWGGTQYDFTGSPTAGQEDFDKLLANWLN